MKTKIVITTPQKAILTFYTEQPLDFKEGMLLFTDASTNTKRGFPTGWCEITEVK